MTAFEPLTEVEAREPIGRYLDNAMGVPEVVIMDRWAWAYFDWLAENCGRDTLIEWVTECDKLRGASTLGGGLQTWLYWEWQRRNQAGMPRPDWLPPFVGDPDFPEPS